MSKRKPVRTPRARSTAPVEDDPLALDDEEVEAEEVEEVEAEEVEAEEVEAEEVEEVEAEVVDDDPDPEPDKVPPKPAKAAAVKVASDSLLVRVKPFNRRRGQTLRSYSYRGFRFREGLGWYAPPRDIAEYLRGVRCSDMDPDSPLAFEVVTLAEAKAIDDREQIDQLEAAKATAPRRGR